MVFEREAAEALGLSLVPGSGNQWHSRSDASGRIRLSCKSTTGRRTWGETRSQIVEAIDMAAGTGETPALAVEDADGERFLVMRLADAAVLLTEDPAVLGKPSRSRAIRDSADTPALLRDDHDPEQR
jgi:hypothetical protein